MRLKRPVINQLVVDKTPKAETALAPCLADHEYPTVVAYPKRQGACWSRMSKRPLLRSSDCREIPKE